MNSYEILWQWILPIIAAICLVAIGSFMIWLVISMYYSVKEGE